MAVHVNAMLESRVSGQRADDVHFTGRRYVSLFDGFLNGTVMVFSVASLCHFGWHHNVFSVASLCSSRWHLYVFLLGICMSFSVVSLCLFPRGIFTSFSVVSLCRSPWHRYVFLGGIFICFSMTSPSVT